MHIIHIFVHQVMVCYTLNWHRIGYPQSSPGPQHPHLRLHPRLHPPPPNQGNPGFWLIFMVQYGPILIGS